MSQTPVRAYEEAYRTGHPTVESESPLGIGVDLEKQWTSIKPSSSSDTSLPDFEKAKTKPDDVSGEPNPITETATARRVVTAQDWTGPDDPENPHNWPLRKRIYHTIIPGIFGFTV